MTDIFQPHDRFLRALLSQPDTAGTLLRERLPKEVAELLSAEPPELVDGSFVDEELRTHLTDRLYKAKTLTGRTALLYVLIEHKSSPDPRIGWQLLKYMVEALKQWEREHPNWNHLPAIVPFVFYHGVAKWKIPDEFLALVDAEKGWWPWLLNFQFKVFDLGEIEDQALSRQPRLRAWLLAAKYATRGGQQQDVKELLVEALADAKDDFYIIMRYIVETYGSYNEQIVREIIQRVQPEEEKAMMSQFAKDVLGKDRQKWEKIISQQIQQEGRLKEAAGILHRLLLRKFGSSQPNWVDEKLTNASINEIELWTDRILDAQSLDEVFMP